MKKSVMVTTWVAFQDSDKDAPGYTLDVSTVKNEDMATIAGEIVANMESDDFDYTILTEDQEKQIDDITRQGIML